MNCPQCNESYSMTIGEVFHGERVRRVRKCTNCQADWNTVEITIIEHATLVKSQAQTEKVRAQVAQMWEENGG